jgi:iron only hydrogenase large subunit-like protein
VLTLFLQNANEVAFSTEALPPSDLPPAQISLTDCLACSGCVTSAEAVLVSLQSHSEVLSALDSAPALRLEGNTDTAAIRVPIKDNEGRIYVASVSPQSRASIAATFGISGRNAGYMIEQLLSGPQGLRAGGKYGNGFQWIVDTSVARDACLVLGAEEVMASLNDDTAATQPSKPILTSSCPGWICYAEKTHPHVLPHLSRLKSPQALMGTILKTTLSKRLGISPDRIWHVAVMPCFDKKLEASREELTDVYWDNSSERAGVRDVDCVITSKELLMLADSRGIDFASLPRSPCSPTDNIFPDSVLANFLFHHRPGNNNGDRAAGTSGGNFQYILQHFASQHSGSYIESAKGRNADVVEHSVLSASGEILFKTARYYGFRNIQNLVRKLKPARPSRMPGGRPVGSARKPGQKAAGPEYAYVEVMACPGGCTNGGGQIKVDDPIMSRRPAGEVKPGPQEQKDWLAMVDEAYFSGSEDGQSVVDCGADIDNCSDTVGGISPTRIKDTLGHWSEITGIELDRLAYTTYRAVISDVGKGKVTDTERVVQLAGKIGGGW